LVIKNIFLDRDGTIIRDLHYLSDPEKISFIPGAVQAMREMKEFGLNIFLVTNQSGIGRKYFSEKDCLRVQDRLASLLRNNGISISEFLFCPHSPEDGCKCRKPAPGMWIRLSEKYGLSPDESIIIGDKKSDIYFGRNCGFRASVLTLTGHGLKEMKDLGIEEAVGEWFEPDPQSIGPTAVAGDIYSAWNWIKQRFFDVN